MQNTELIPVIACLRLVELCPMTTPLAVGPALVYEDKKIEIFKTMQDMAAVIMRDGLDTKRVPSRPPVPGIIDLPRSLWYELQAICSQLQPAKMRAGESAVYEGGSRLG